MKNKKSIMFICVLVLIVGAVFAVKLSKGSNEALAEESSFNKATVVKGAISDTISSSSVIESEKRQQIKIKKAGTIENVYVTEGQRVEKGDILMVMESSNENTDLEIAKKNLEMEMADLNDLKSDQSSSYIYATVSGVYTGSGEVLEEGKTVNIDQDLGEIYDQDVLELKVLFNLGVKDKFTIGENAKVVIPETFEELTGKISNITESSTMLESGNFGYEVTVEIENKGALGQNITPQVTVSNSNGVFTSLEVVSIGKKEGAGISSQIKGKLEVVNVSEGDYVNKGDLLFRISDDDIQKSIEKQEITIEQKLLEINNKVENLNDVALTAPISGTIIKLTASEGDNVESNEQVAIIADTDNLMVNIDVDELDVYGVEVGQVAVITTDVFKNKSFQGSVESIAMEGVPANGVSTFEVGIKLSDERKEELKLGLNVNVEITQGQSDSALLLPVEAVMKRGNRYMVMTEVPSGDQDANNKNRLQEVKVGLVTDTMVEIIEGLEEGDEVYYSSKISTNSSNDQRKQMMMMGNMPGGMPGGRKSGGGAKGQ